jgi:hypothetical protein
MAKCIASLWRELGFLEQSGGNHVKGTEVSRMDLIRLV